VESAMAALVPTGAPVSVLMDHGLGEEIAEKLIEAGVGTVENLGSMTPEELETIPGIEPDIVEKILIAVNSYYSQFEQQSSAAAEVPPELEAIEPVAQADGNPANGDALVAQPVTELASSVEEESVEDSVVPKKEFDTIKNSGEVS